LIFQRYRRRLLLAALLASAIAPGAARAEERDGWTIDPSLYVFIPGITGTVGIGPIDVDLNGASTAIIHINFAAMGSVRVGYRGWALTTDAMYADLGATKGDSSGRIEEAIVEPTLSYAVWPWFEPLAGVRYQNVAGSIDGPFGHSRALSQGWFDPIVGLRLRFPLSDSVSLGFRGDVGGFGVGSKLTWQIFPYVDWRLAKILSLQAGYRALSVDYENGTGKDRVLYDVVELGLQFGVTFLFDL
jgi:hypothetical protein